MNVSRRPKAIKNAGLLLALTLSLQIPLAGCGSATDAQTTSTPEVKATAQAENPVKDFVTLTWYMPKPIDNLKDQDAVEAEANKIIKEKINANLKLNLIDNASWEDKIKMVSAAGEAYDLVYTSNWSNRIDNAVARGALKPLDTLLDKYGPNIRKKVDTRAWKAVTYSGKIMAVPSQSPFAQGQSFVFKKDLVEKYNFDYKKVQSLADLEPYLETIRKNEPGITPLLVTSKITAAGDKNFNEVSITKGVAFNEKTSKIEYSLEIPESLATFKKINEFYKKGYISKDAATKTDYSAEAKSGKYAVMRDSGGYTEDGSKATAQYGFPCVEALYGYPLISTAGMTGALAAVSNSSKNPERAVMLLDLIWSNKTLLNTLAFGLEGKNYTVTAGKGTDSPTVVAKSGAEQTWAIWHNWLGPLWDQWDSNWNTTKALEKMKSDNDKAKTATILGFLFNPEAVKAEVAQVSAVYKEIEPVLYTGVASDYDKFIAESMDKLKRAGIDKVRDEAQKQYDAWKTAK